MRRLLPAAMADMEETVEAHLLKSREAAVNRRQNRAVAVQALAATAVSRLQSLESD